MKSSQVIAVAVLLGSSGLSHAEISGSGHQIEGCTGVIDTFVWHDANQNGIQDNGEKPIRDVAVQIQRAAEPDLGTDTLITGQDGRVRFYNLCLAEHLLWIDRDTLPFGMVPTAITVGSEQRDVLDEAIDSRNGAIVVALNSNFLEEETLSFGFAPKECHETDNRRCADKGPGTFHQPRRDMAQVTVTNTEGERAD